MTDEAGINHCVTDVREPTPRLGTGEQKEKYEVFVIVRSQAPTSTDAAELDAWKGRKKAFADQLDKELTKVIDDLSAKYPPYVVPKDGPSPRPFHTGWMQIIP